VKENTISDNESLFEVLVEKKVIIYCQLLYCVLLDL